MSLGQHSRGSFWEKWEDDADPLEGWFPAQEIQFLGVEKQDGHCHVPVDVIPKIAAMTPPTSKNETQTFLGTVGVWRMHVPDYSHTVSPLYHVTLKRSCFVWCREQQAFELIK